jgi:predicted Zn-dependent peptidase
MFKKYVLDNGIKVLTNRVPRVASAVTGFWVEAGSRFETERQAGYAHFVEHMLFKGTKKRSAGDIARQMDRIGAVTNAATNREYTVYYIHSLHEHLDLSLDVLTDIVQNSLFKSSEIEREKKVILEEIKMIEDSPEETLGDLFLRTILPDHPLGRPVIGNNTSVLGVNRSGLVSFFDRNYRNSGLVVSIAGNLRSDEVLKRLDKVRLKESPPTTAGHQPPGRLHFGRVNRDKDVQQVHFILGFPGISLGHKLYFPLLALNAVLGGGISSRLFQEIREKQALCYNVFSSPLPFFDSGIFNIYCATDEKKFNTTLDSILSVCRKLRKNLLTKEELNDAKAQIRCQIALASENIEFLMHRMVTQERLFGRQIPIRSVLESIRKITMDEVRQAADIIFDSKLTHHLATVGPKGHAKRLGLE